MKQKRRYFFISPFLKYLAKKNESEYIKGNLGDIAQLVERLNGIQEVSGSIPLISTSFFKSLLGAFFFLDCNGISL